MSRCLPAILMATMSGCTVGPEFHRPAPPPLDRYTEAPLSPATVVTDVPGGAAQHLVIGRDVPGDWWILFGSPALATLVATALRDSPTIEAVNAQLRQAQEQELAQKGALFPSVNGTLGLSRQEQPQSYLS